MAIKEKGLVVTWLRGLDPWTVAKATITVLAVLAIARMALSLVSLGLVLLGGLVVAAMMLPAVQWLEDHRVPRPLALALVVLFILAVGGGALYAVLPMAVGQARELLEHLPAYTLAADRRLDQLTGSRSLLGGVVEREQVVAMLSGRAGSIIEGALSLTTSVLGALAGLALVITLAVFLLLDRESIGEGVLRFFPEAQRQRAERMLPRIARAVGTYLSGVVTLGVIIGAVTAVGLSLLGVPYALVLGIAAGFLEMVPYVGPFVAAALGALVALGVSPWLALWALAFQGALQQLEGIFLAPFVLGRTLRMAPFWVMVSLLVGAGLAGVPGALLALPVAISVRILLNEVERHLREEREAAEPPSHPA